jgi:hypothetical protein
VVTNIKGDTVKTLTGPGGVGLHRATWDLRGRPRPLGPAGLRDSIIAARVRRQRDDSVRAARGADTTAGAGRVPPVGDTAAFMAARDSMAAMRARGDTAGLRVFRERTLARGGAGGRRGQGGLGAGAPGEINLRPAEAPVGGAAGGGGGEGGGGFFGGGRAGNLVDAGDYLVTINAGGQIMKQVVHVERVGDIVNVDFGPDEDDEGGGGDPNDP